MNSSRIRTGRVRGEVAPNTWSDFAWAGLHREELFERYGDCILLIYNQQVIGVGQTFDEVIADAESKLPTDSGEVTPITHFSSSRYKFISGYLRKRE